MVDAGEGVNVGWIAVVEAVMEVDAGDKAREGGIGGWLWWLP